MRGAFLGRPKMRGVRSLLPPGGARRTVPTLRRARRFGRPPAGDGLILTTTRMLPTMATLRLGQPETGRGDASLWTAAAAPDHRLWTTLRGPVDPSWLPTSPLPRRRLRIAKEQPIPIIQKERRRTQHTSCRSATGAHPEALTGGPFPSIEVGHTGLSKAPTGMSRATGPACRLETRRWTTICTRSCTR